MEVVLYRKNNIKTLIILVLCIIMILSAQVVYAFDVGGYISQYLVSMTGITDSQLLIGMDGITGSNADVGMSPIIDTLSATNVIYEPMVYATLNANVSDMNESPSAVAYFEWGYDTTYGYTTSQQTVTGVGDISAIVTGISSFPPPKTIHYRSVIMSDGVYYGSDQTFVLSESVEVYRMIHPGYFLLILMGVFFLIYVVITKIEEPRDIIIAIFLVIFLIALGMSGLGVVQSFFQSLW